MYCLLNPHSFSVRESVVHVFEAQGLREFSQAARPEGSGPGTDAWLSDQKPGCFPQGQGPWLHVLFLGYFSHCF